MAMVAVPNYGANLWSRSMLPADGASPGCGGHLAGTSGRGRGEKAREKRKNRDMENNTKRKGETTESENVRV